MRLVKHAIHLSIYGDVYGECLLGCYILTTSKGVWRSDVSVDVVSPETSKRLTSYQDGYPRVIVLEYLLT